MTAKNNTYPYSKINCKEGSTDLSQTYVKDSKVQSVIVNEEETKAKSSLTMFDVSSAVVQP